NSGWRTLDWKVVHEAPAWPGLELQAGLRHEAYRLGITVHASDDYLAGQRSAQAAGSGGRTRLDAIWVQAWQDLGDHWELGLGLRQEWWQSQGGYYGADDPATAGFEQATLPGRKRSASSPKFSLAFLPAADWSLRYSLARA